MLNERLVRAWRSQPRHKVVHRPDGVFVPNLQDFIPDLLAWLVIALFCSAVIIGLKLSVARGQSMLPPQRHRAVPWRGPEIFLAFCLAFIFWQVVLDLLLTR